MSLFFLLLACVTTENRKTYVPLYPIQREGLCAYVLDNVSNHYISNMKKFKENHKTATSANLLHGSVANFCQIYRSKGIRTGKFTKKYLF